MHRIASENLPTNRTADGAAISISDEYPKIVTENTVGGDMATG